VQFLPLPEPALTGEEHVFAQISTLRRRDVERLDDTLCGVRSRCPCAVVLKERFQIFACPADLPGE
jgi:hypothetical protein